MTAQFRPRTKSTQLREHDEKVSPTCNRRIARARLGERSPSRSPEAGFKPMEEPQMEKMENESRSVL